MPATIRFKRGIQANLPNLLQMAEPAFTTDTNKLYIGTDIANNNIEVGNKDVGPMTTIVRGNSGYWSEINNPQESDFIKLRSFRYSFLGGGPDITENTSQLNRWLYLIDNPTSSLTFNLRSAYIKGRRISTNTIPSNLRSITVGNGGEPVTGDVWDLGGGQTTFVPTNYINYLNNLCQYFDLASRFGSTIDQNLTHKVAMSGNVCVLDRFYFAFEENSTNVSFQYEVPDGAGGFDFVDYKPQYFYSISTAAPDTLFESRAFGSGINPNFATQLLAGPGLGPIGNGIGYWRVQP